MSVNALEEVLRESVKRTKDELDSFYEDNFFGLEKDKFYTGYELRTTCHAKAVSALEAYLKYKNDKPCISSRISDQDKAWAERIGALNYEVFSKYFNRAE